MKIKEALELANIELKDAGIDNYFFESRELLAFILEKSKEWIICNMEFEIPDDKYAKFLDLKYKRMNGTPFQYILGEQYFMGLKFIVNKDVLIPRADTEILIYNILELFRAKEGVKILDMCTGSGCIAVSLAKNLKNANVYGADISEKALNIAKKNAEINNVNVEFYNSDLFNKIPNEKFDIIVSNPPYITTKDMKSLQREVMSEPSLALDGGEDGLFFYRKISEDALLYLNDNGVIVFEIGFNQGDTVKEILIRNNYRDIRLIKDYSGNDRVLIAIK